MEIKRTLISILVLKLHPATVPETERHKSCNEIKRQGEVTPLIQCHIETHQHWTQTPAYYQTPRERRSEIKFPGKLKSPKHSNPKELTFTMKFSSSWKLKAQSPKSFFPAFHSAQSHQRHLNAWVQLQVILHIPGKIRGAKQHSVRQTTQRHRVM